MTSICQCLISAWVSIPAVMVLVILCAADGQYGIAGEPSKRPSLIVAPFDTKTAEKHQQEWAKYLGVPVRITNSIGMTLTLIPAGEFMMGSPESEDWRNKDERPHSVRITKPFYLGVYEVTQEEYEKVIGENPSFFSPNAYYGERVSGLDTRRFPVDKVTWRDAAEYCRKLSSLAQEDEESRSYRLPTEAEWEYACRAGTTTPFHFGAASNGRRANCDGRYPYGTTVKGPFLNRPSTSGSYPPNAFVLYDMHGNVREWCQDWYGEDYYRQSPKDDPKGPTAGDARVDRGGSWLDRPEWFRSANRRRGSRHPNNTKGFRVVLVLPEASLVQR